MLYFICMKTDKKTMQHIYSYKNTTVGHQRFGWNYIGRTINKSGVRRHRRDNIKCLDWQSQLGPDLRELGNVGFDIQNIWSGTCTFKDISELEAAYITEYNSLTPKGYNQNPGGGGVLEHSDATKKKMRLSKTPESESELKRIALLTETLNNRTPEEVAASHDKAKATILAWPADKKKAYSKKLSHLRQSDGRKRRIKTIKDMLGKVFNKLTVLHLDKKRSTSDLAFFICKCECGKKKSVSLNHLRRNMVMSCGCANIESGSRQRQSTIDKMISKRFGKLTVISCDDENTDRFLYLTCLCDCGKIKNKCNRSSLIDGKLTSCGCARQDNCNRQKANTIKSMIGKTFGRLTVLKHNKKKSIEKGSDYYTCRCSCGSTVIMCGTRIRFGTTKSCGCILREITVKRNKLGKQRKFKS